MDGREEPAWVKGIIGLTAARAQGDIDRQFQNRLTVTRSMIERLGLETELHGHTGCVNCLEWNHDGSILASASDDLHVILWDPYRYKELHNMPTGHAGNIFSVKFLEPGVVATCAADGWVRARGVEAVGEGTLFECACHCGRVKRLAAAPHQPHVLWSAGEDGLVLQHDLRVPHRCSTDCANVVVNLLNHLGRYAEAKCVAVNPRRPYQLAVGANDYYVRLYDRRMIKVAKLQLAAPLSRSTWERQKVRCSNAGQGDPDDSIPRSAVHYFAPGHLTLTSEDQMFPKKATTYATFSNNGSELLVNMGSEHIYVFDIDNGRTPVLVENFILQSNHPENKGKLGANGTVSIAPQRSLPDAVRIIKEMANEHVNKGNYIKSVELYNTAIAECPDCAVLYSNRAAALLRRGWSGDTYAAIKDCYAAIKLDPNHVKSHFRLAKALMDMKKVEEAQSCLQYFKNKFPKHASSHAVFLLQKDIQVSVQNETSDDERASPSGEQGEHRREGGTSALETELRAAAWEHELRFVGHCNTTTDIKEASFLGPDSNYIAAGSDDGSMFIWCRKSGNIVRCLRGDDSIVNCVQLHPRTCLLATSGIEAVVRLWSPRPENELEERLVEDVGAAAKANQLRMRSDPFEAMLMNIGFAGGHERDLHSPACRTT